MTIDTRPPFPKEDAIEQQIMHRTWGRVHQLKVELADGRLILHGYATTYHAKQLALEAALDALNSTEATAVELNINVEKAEATCCSPSIR